jgi:RNA 3'-terminal phosphate cyclase (ATP)
MIEIDGSQGEGGGQILRTALALSMCTGQPFRLHQIRAKRKKPGLMRQHLACVNAARSVCSADVVGAELGATEIVFAPNAVRAGQYEFAIAGAGSTLLVLQTVLPALLKADAPSTVRISGGTHNPMAPPFEFIERAFVPWVHRLGGGLHMTLRRCGFYPAGRGEFTAVITPFSPDPNAAPLHVDDRGELLECYAEALSGGVLVSVGARELDAVSRMLHWSGDQLRTRQLRQNEGPGNALLATLRYENATEVFCELGERGITSVAVAQRLAKQVRAYTVRDAPIGAHLADQLMLLFALTTGGSFHATEITEHTRTNAAVIERFLPVNISMDVRSDATALVSIELR